MQPPMSFRQFRSGFWMKDDLSFVNIGNVTADREIHEICILRVRQTIPPNVAERGKVGSL